MRRIYLLLLAGLTLGACSGLRVYSDIDRTVDFSQYNTLEFHGWSDNSDQIMNRFDRERIEMAFGNEFRSRGTEVVEQGEGDLIVALYIVTEQNVDRSATTYHHGGYGRYYGYGPGYGWGGGHSTTHINAYEYTTGTLVVSVFDAQRQELIWEGIGTGTVDENPQNRERHIPRAVARIMQEYPVAPIVE